MNHNFEIKYLIDTKGISLVTDVINIHAKYIKIVIVIGCLRNFSLKIFLFVIFIMNNNKTPSNKGSVGNDIPIPISKSRKFMANGVQKTIRNSNLSNENIYRNKIISPTGIKAAQYNSWTIKKVFNAINNALTI